MMCEVAQMWDMPGMFQQNTGSSAGFSLKYKWGASGRDETEKVGQDSRF